MQPRLSVFVLKWVEMFSYALSRHRNAPQNCNYAKQIAKYSNSVLPLWLFSGGKKNHNSKKYDFVAILAVCQQMEEFH